MTAVAVIPARGGSKRLPGKNLYPVLGVPMIAWAIRACRDARGISAVYVSTEDEAIARTARAWGVEVIDRPAALAEDAVPKQAAIVHAVEQLAAQGRAFDLIVSVQPNSPELTGSDLDRGIDKLRVRDLWEVFSVDSELIQNGAFRAMRRETALRRTLSAHCGVVVVDCIDVHTAEDVARAEARLAARGARRPELDAVTAATGRGRS